MHTIRQREVCFGTADLDVHCNPIARRKVY